jgi:CubicO group peptidase (beta-lactamase class C family)
VGAENPTIYAAAGTVHLSIKDFAKYARWHLAGKPAPLLRSQAAFDYLHQPRVDYSVAGAKYGCGWICADTGLGPALNHFGSNTNSSALIWILPQADFAAIVCTNTGQPQAFAACDEMISHLMKEIAIAGKPTMKASQRAGFRGSVATISH